MSRLGLQLLKALPLIPKAKLAHQFELINMEKLRFLVSGGGLALCGLLCCLPAHAQDTFAGGYVKEDGLGGYYTEQGHVSADGNGGYIAPQGHFRPDGVNGYQSHNMHLVPNGTGGYDSEYGTVQPNGEFKGKLYQDGMGGYFSPYGGVTPDGQGGYHTPAGHFKAPMFDPNSVGPKGLGQYYQEPQP